MTTIPIVSIIVTDRQRQDLGDLDNDFKSVKEVGLIQPIVVEEYEEVAFDEEGNTINDTRHRLISGGRRLAWLKKNGYTELFHGVTCDPKRPGYVLSSELSELQHQEAELYENIKRHKLSWVEECKAVAKVHRLRWRENKDDAITWSQEHTANLLGFKGAAKVTYALQVADELNANPESPLLLCETYRDAVKYLIEQTERLARAEQDRRREIANQYQLKLDEQKTDTPPTEPTLPIEEDISPSVTIQISSMVLHGTIESVGDQLPCDRYRCAFVIDKSDSWIPHTHRLLTKDAFVIWAHGGVYRKTDESVFPFKLLPWPVIWHVLDIDPKPPYPFAMNMQFFDILTKGEPISCNPKNTSIVSANVINRLTIPDTVVEFLLSSTSIGGDDILMPTGGPVGIVAQMGRRPCSIEKHEELYRASVEELKEIYNNRHMGKVVFV